MMGVSKHRSEVHELRGWVEGSGEYRMGRGLDLGFFDVASVVLASVVSLDDLEVGFAFSTLSLCR
jgi:hypothetical protein